MAIINNEEVSKQIINDAKLSVSEGVPNQLANQVVPVLISNPLRKAIIANGTRAVTGAGQLYAVPNDGNDYYLTGLHVTLTFSAACNSVRTYIRGDLEDTKQTNMVLMDFIYVDGVTAGAGNQFTQNIQFPNPIRLTPSSTIDIVNSFAAGAQTTNAIAVLYKVNKH